MMQKKKKKKERKILQSSILIVQCPNIAVVVLPQMAKFSFDNIANHLPKNEEAVEKI